MWGVVAVVVVFLCGDEDEGMCGKLHHSQHCGMTICMDTQSGVLWDSRRGLIKDGQRASRRLEKTDSFGMRVVTPHDIDVRIHSRPLWILPPPLLHLHHLLLCHNLLLRLLLLLPAGVAGSSQCRRACCAHGEREETQRKEERWGGRGRGRGRGREGCVGGVAGGRSSS